MSTRRFFASLTLAVICTVVANLCFHLWPRIQWRNNPQAVAKEATYRNEFWQLVDDIMKSPAHLDRSAEPSDWSQLANEIARTLENNSTNVPSNLLQHRWDTRPGIFGGTYVIDHSRLFNSWLLRLKPGLLSPSDPRLDWMVHWRHYRATDAAMVDLNGKTIIPRGGSCRMGDRFTRQFNYELANFVLNRSSIILPTDRPIPPTPVCLINWRYEKTGPTPFQVFPVDWSWQSMLSALVGLAIMSALFYGGLSWLSVAGRIRRTTGPLRPEIKALRRVENDLRQIAAGYAGCGEPLPELERCRSLMQRVDAANQKSGFRDRAEPGTPGASTIERARRTMDVIEEWLRL